MINDAKVESLKDKSGNNNDLTQSDMKKQPLTCDLSKLKQAMTSKMSEIEAMYGKDFSTNKDIECAEYFRAKGWSGLANLINNHE